MRLFKHGTPLHHDAHEFRSLVEAEMRKLAKKARKAGFDLHDSELLVSHIVAASFTVERAKAKKKAKALG